ncbi:MAG: hypothetical protein Q8L53_16630 [Aestuariivirga sp.]|nr:hypothetical protein [Aestuariivirga sp.]
MTPPELAKAVEEQVKRLRKRGHPMSLSGAALFNPDGEGAAALILSMAERIKTLEGALKQVKIYGNRKVTEIASRALASQPQAGETEG